MALRSLDAVLGGIAKRIAPTADDVPAYHLPNRWEVMMLGTQSLPAGIMVGARGLDRLLRVLTPTDDTPIVEVRSEDDES